MDAYLDRAAIALARQHGYLLCGRLLLEGLTPELLPFVQQIPELATAVPPAYDDESAAVHYQNIFGFNLFPFQSIFLDRSGLVGGQETKRVQQFLGKVGYEGVSDVDADHMGQLLLCLAALCEDGGQQARQQQAELLGQHLLRWLLPFTCALKLQKRDFYTALADLLLIFVADHAQDLAEELTRQRPYTLPQPPAILNDKKSGWKEIAAFLLTPMATGIYLGRDMIGALARQFKLPRGFGDRQQMLVNLIQSAIVYDSFGEAMMELERITAVYQTHYLTQQPHFPHDATLAEQWQDQTVHTIEFLKRLQSLVA